MTFSIVASDARTGECGVAIATARVAAAGRCIFVTAAGAVASQALAEPALAFAVLDSLGRGRAAQAAVDDAVAADSRAGVRQVVAVDVHGRTGAWTGPDVTGWAGHVRGHRVAAAGNILSGPRTVQAMLDAYEQADGDLADRLLTALAAGDRAGGDVRGRQSAAVLVGTGAPWPVLDLRVDDDAQPLIRLRRLRELWRREWGVYDRTGAFPPARPPGVPAVPA